MSANKPDCCLISVFVVFNWLGNAITLSTTIYTFKCDRNRNYWWDPGRITVFIGIRMIRLRTITIWEIIIQCITRNILLIRLNVKIRKEKLTSLINCTVFEYAAWSNCSSCGRDICIKLWVWRKSGRFWAWSIFVLFFNTNRFFCFMCLIWLK